MIILGTQEPVFSFRKSPSHYRNSMPKVVITTCQRLGVHEEALEMIMDPVKYGLFPMRKAIDALLQCCVQEEDIQGVSVHAVRVVKMFLTCCSHVFHRHSEGDGIDEAVGDGLDREGALFAGKSELEEDIEGERANV